MDYKHYIEVNEDGYIINGYSSAFVQATENSICISDQAGRHFSLLGEYTPELQKLDGSYNYQYVNGKVVKV